MNLSSPSVVKNILEKYHLKPSLRLGQNFLIDENILKKIIAAADIKKDDVVLEVGPGLGTLTQALATQAKKVLAVEKDKHLVEVLEETLKEYPNVDVIQSDILKYSLPSSAYKVVANIPYYLTSHLIRELLESKVPPSLIVLMIQKEVAERMMAKPPNMNLLAVSVQYYAEPKIISAVSQNCFYPKPKIDSAIVTLTAKPKKEESPDLFFKVVRAGFSQKRKQLANNLANQLKLEKKMVETILLQHNISPQQRAETLTIEDWQKIAGTINSAF